MKVRLVLALLVTGAMAPLSVAAAQTPDATNNQPTATSSDVIVTAQRREERLKDVPIAIKSVTGKQLAVAGITSSTDLGLVTPGLYFAVQGAFAQPTIRGIGTTVTGGGNDANVSLYIDGVYQPSQTGNLFDLNDVQRIDVLKGPQGTLFGRNATGGAILITTLNPSFNPSADLYASYGSFNELKLGAYLTGGITNDLAGDLSVQYKHDDGYVKNVNTGDEIANARTISIRTKLLFQPTNNLSFVLSANYSDVQDNSPFAVKPLNGVVQFANLVTIPTNPYDVSLTTDPQIRTESFGGSLQAKYDMDAGTLTSTTSIERVRPFLSVDIDNISRFVDGAILPSLEVTATQELNFASKQMGRFSWVGGFYYYYDDSDAKGDLITFPGFNYPLSEGDLKTNAEAVYAEGNYDLTDRIRLIAGVRYSNENKDDISFTPGVPGAQHTWGAWTPRASIRFKIDEFSDLYATYSRGFKSGTFYQASGQAPTPVAPESVDAYEVGYKLARGRFSFDTSAYYYSYSNIQVQIQENINHQLTTITQNAATATIYGLDADLQGRLSENWTIDAGAAYTHARYDQYPNAIVYIPDLQTIGGVTYKLGNVINPALNGNGKNMIRTPEFTGFLTATYTHPLPVGSVEVDGTASYNSGFFWDPGNTVKQNPYTIVNAAISWISPDDKWKLTLWGKNLAEEKYYIYVNNTTTGNAGAIARPLSAGVSVDVKFK